MDVMKLKRKSKKNVQSSFNVVFSRDETPLDYFGYSVGLTPAGENG